MNIKIFQNFKPTNTNRFVVYAVHIYADLRLLTLASHSPSKLGAAGVIKCHAVPFTGSIFNKSEFFSADLYYVSILDRHLESLSLYKCKGLPRRVMKR